MPPFLSSHVLRQLNLVVLALRGTSSAKDVLVDLVCEAWETKMIASLFWAGDYGLLPIFGGHWEEYVLMDKLWEFVSLNLNHCQNSSSDCGRGITVLLPTASDGARLPQLFGLYSTCSFTRCGLSRWVFTKEGAVRMPTSNIPNNRCGVFRTHPLVHTCTFP